jgi:hypothetical protein
MEPSIRSVRFALLRLHPRTMKRPWKRPSSSTSATQAKSTNIGDPRTRTSRRPKRSAHLPRLSGKARTPTRLHPYLQICTNPGAPCLDSETWESTNPTRPCFVSGHDLSRASAQLTFRIVTGNSRVWTRRAVGRNGASEPKARSPWWGPASAFWEGAGAF